MTPEAVPEGWVEIARFDHDRYVVVELPDGWHLYTDDATRARWPKDRSNPKGRR